MRKGKTIIIVIITIIVFWFLKFVLIIPSGNTETIRIILTITSILFGFLAGFFISELWTRYTEIRGIIGTKSADGVNLINYAKKFYKNKKFEKEFKLLIEKAAICDEIVEWDEGHLEIPYYQDIENSFKYIKVKTIKESIYFKKFLDNYDRFIEGTVRLDTLGKEKLFMSEWFIMYILSVIISISILFLNTNIFIYKIIIFIFPTIIVLALSIIHDLNKLTWSKNITTLEPNERLFDAIGVKRFYLKRKQSFIPKHHKDYRTEDDLKGEFKKVYLDVIAKQNKKAKFHK